MTYFSIENQLQEAIDKKNSQIAKENVWVLKYIEQRIDGDTRVYTGQLKRAFKLKFKYSRALDLDRIDDIALYMGLQIRIDRRSNRRYISRI